MGSLETCRLYALDPRQWTVIEEDNVPGRPYGIAVVGDELRVVCGEGEEDDRVIRRFVPGHGFKSRDTLECPDGTGSQLSYDGTWLYLSQWYNRRILGLDDQGAIVREIELPRGICGQCFLDGAFYTITTDDEESREYFFGKIGQNGDGRYEDLARVPFAARALAFDGSRFWTNHREANQIVAFEP